METTFGFRACCAAAGVLATVTVATEASDLSQVRLVILIVEAAQTHTPKSDHAPANCVAILLFWVPKSDYDIGVTPKDMDACRVLKFPRA